MSCCSVRYVVKEGGQWRQGVGAKAPEFSHQVLPQLAIHQRHSQVLFRGGQQLTIICTLQVQLHVWGEKTLTKGFVLDSSSFFQLVW